MSSELKLDQRIAQWAIQALGRLVATFAIVLGILIIFGGPERWSTPLFKVTLLVPGSPTSWGVTILIAGSMALVGSLMSRLYLVAVGMILISVWCGLFAISFLAAAVQSESSSFTSVACYLVLAIISAAIGVVYKESR